MESIRGTLHLDATLFAGFRKRSFMVNSITEQKNPWTDVLSLYCTNTSIPHQVTILREDSTEYTPQQVI